MSRQWVMVVPQPDEWINANHRTHWAVTGRRVVSWRGAAKLHARRVHLPVGLGRARVECAFQFTDARRRDVGNLAPTAKAIVDGLVDYGLLPDDDDAHLIGPDLRRGPKSPDGIGLVVVTVTELDPTLEDR